MAGTAAANVRPRIASRLSALRGWIERPPNTLAGVLVVAALVGLLVAASDAAFSRLIGDQRSYAAARLSLPGSSVGPSQRAIGGGAAGVEANDQPRAAANYAFAWPADGEITTGMSYAHPTGIDLAATLGEPIRAVRAGVVREAGGDVCCLYGYHVVVEHDAEWTTLYGHLSEILVQPGDRVEQGQVLGLAGDTGKATGVHLHLELWSFGSPVNPLDYLEPLRYYVAAYVPASAPDASVEPAQTKSEPASKDAGALSADRAIDRAVLWMAVQGENGYAVDRGTCFAVAAGPNWSVSCTASAPGCEQTLTCETLLEACVVGAAGLVEAVCSGY